MNEILENLVSKNILIANEGDDYVEFRRMIKNRNPDDFVVFTEKSSDYPIRISTIGEINQIPVSSINSLEMFSKKLAEPYCADTEVPAELFLIYITKTTSVMNFPGIILLKGNIVDAILPGKSLFKLLSSFEKKLGIKGTRSPDPFGVIAFLQVPDLVCYRCLVCNHVTKISMRDSVPLCNTPWHGKMVLTPCIKTERS